MPLFTATIILLLIISAGLCYVTLRRLFHYNEKYHLPESSYTKLFDFITKEHVAIAYIIFVGLHLIITIWFIWTL
ncbi:hypothetical protein HY605_01360 [Candidatus Peregrinibacteria bacterium]|nr:hypothetical protein [Candidatus Peregrinibacteria bacterium]